MTCGHGLMLYHVFMCSFEAKSIFACVELGLYTSGSSHFCGAVQICLGCCYVSDFKVIFVKKSKYDLIILIGKWSCKYVTGEND